MAGGKVETDPKVLAEHCENFMGGAKRLYDGERIKAMKGDMWLFEIYHHLNDCAAALRKAAQRLPDDRRELTAPTTLS